jgi:hypothetical protein
MSSLNAVYTERNKLLALVAKQAIALGFQAGVMQDLSGDKCWQNVVIIDLPSGQCAWHIHKTEMVWFAFLDPYLGAWKGHSTEQKYARVQAAQYKPPSLEPELIYLENSGVFA